MTRVAPRRRAYAKSRWEILRDERDKLVALKLSVTSKLERVESEMARIEQDYLSRHPEISLEELAEKLA